MLLAAGTVKTQNDSLPYLIAANLGGIFQSYRLLTFASVALLHAHLTLLCAFGRVTANPPDSGELT